MVAIFLAKVNLWKKIPIGISNFIQLLHDDCIYVDKTKEILFIVKNNRYALFSRPRRFGKSLTLDAIETLFIYGTEPYFKGTYIAGNNEDGTPRWTEPTYPVLRLDFSAIAANDIPTLRSNFITIINEQCHKLGIEEFPVENKRIGDVLSAFTIRLNKTYVLLLMNTMLLLMHL